MNENNRQIFEDQTVRFKQSHIFYQGLLFFNTINMCDRGRTITHMQIPRFHTQVWYDNNFHPKLLFQYAVWKLAAFCPAAVC